MSETKNKIVLKTKAQIEDVIDALFVNMSKRLKLKSGDLSPEQAERLYNIKKSLHRLMIDFAYQNFCC